MSKRVRTPTCCLCAVFFCQAMQKANIRLKSPGAIITRNKAVEHPQTGGADNSPWEARVAPGPGGHPAHSLPQGVRCQLPRRSAPTTLFSEPQTRINCKSIEQSTTDQ